MATANIGDLPIESTPLVTHIMELQEPSGNRQVGVGVLLGILMRGFPGSAYSVPATSSDTGIAGQLAFDASYIYICVATNTWKRVAVSTF